MTTPTPPAVSEAMREAVARAIGDTPMENGDDLDPGVLRDWIPDGNPGVTDRKNLLAAADRILSGPIASEIARLTGERDAARAWSENADLIAKNEWLRSEGLVERLRAAEAETARLRAALEEIAKSAPETEPHPWDGELDTVCWNIAKIARAALTSQEKIDA